MGQTNVEKKVLQVTSMKKVDKKRSTKNTGTKAAKRVPRNVKLSPEYKEIEALLKLPMLTEEQYNRVWELYVPIRPMLSVKDCEAITNRRKLLYHINIGGDEHGDFKERVKNRSSIIKLKTREFIFDSIGGESALRTLIEKVYKKALSGSFKHQELLMNYLLGKPVEKLKLEAFDEKSLVPATKTVLQIVADNHRLNKLATDIGVANEVHDGARIEEMEKMLNGENNNGTEQ